MSKLVEPSTETCQRKTYLNVGQPLVSDGRQNVRKQRDTEENEVSVPGLEVFGETHAVRILEQVQRLDEEESRSEVDRQCDGNLTGKITPATDPSRHAAAPGRGEGKGLVVNTTGSRIDRGDFSERSTETQHEQTDCHPTPDHIRRTASGNGVAHGGGNGVGHRGHDKTHKHDLPC